MLSASRWRVEAKLPAPILLPLALPFFLTAATSLHNPNPFFFPHLHHCWCLLFLPNSGAT